MGKTYWAYSTGLWDIKGALTIQSSFSKTVWNI
jgi:hypothetical protein